MCRDLDDDGERECWTSGVTGVACDEAADCQGGVCFEAGSGWPRGYCSQACGLIDCRHGVCEAVDGGLFCLAACDQTPCRAGYQCTVMPDGMKVCLPPQPGCTSDDDCDTATPVCDLTAEPFRCVGCSDNDDCARFGPPRHVCDLASGACVTLRATGAPCSQDAECAGGICFKNWIGGGYCTENCFSFPPDKLPDCSLGGGHCVTWNFIGMFCLATCEPGAPSSCRAGYVCTNVDGDGFWECVEGT